LNLSAVVLVAVAYVAAQMLADITSLRIVRIIGFSVDAGTLIYPFTFTLRDMVHKIAGIKVARLLIFAAAGINLFMAGLFQIVALLPPDMQVGPQMEFSKVLTPVWRIVFASIVAEVISELIDGEVYQAWVNRLGVRLQWMRVLASNSISVPVDSAIFSLIAFASVLPSAVVLSIFYANVIMKGAVTLVSMPWIYLVRDKDLELLDRE
jgi:uncharacterized integral membrane protein (TIGR00697 family)